MIKTLLNTRVNAKIAAGLIAVTAAVGVGLKVNESHAAVTALTGQCGMLYTSNFSGLDPLTTAANSSFTVNNLILIDFTAGTADTQSISISNYGNATTAATNVSHNVITFTQSAGPVSGSYQLTFSGGKVATILPVNSGNTYLVQYIGTNGSSNAPGQGVCQKV